MGKKRSSPTILITGAAGFIGSCLVRELNNKGWENLILIDNLGSGEKWKNLRQKRFLELMPKELLFQWLAVKKPALDAIVHLGACSDTQENNGDYLWENNVHFSQKLISYAVEKKIRCIHASSAATYGDGREGFSEELLRELCPLNLYAFSKQMVDLWLAQTDNLSKVLVLKFFNVFGPNESHKGRMESVPRKWFFKIEKGEDIELFKSNHPHFNDGEQKRDFIYVKEVTELIFQFIERVDITGILNIGSGEPLSWNELAQALLDIRRSSRSKIRYIPMPESLAQKYQNFTCAETTRLEKLLPLWRKGRRGVKEALEDLVANHLLTGIAW